jgi:hypothetical protein
MSFKLLTSPPSGRIRLYALRPYLTHALTIGRNTDLHAAHVEFRTADLLSDVQADNLV